jgi:hypothetical protein
MFGQIRGKNPGWSIGILRNRTTHSAPVVSLNMSYLRINEYSKEVNGEYSDLGFIRDHKVGEGLDLAADI